MIECANLPVSINRFDQALPWQIWFDFPVLASTLATLAIQSSWLASCSMLTPRVTNDYTNMHE